ATYTVTPEANALIVKIGGAAAATATAQAPSASSGASEETKATPPVKVEAEAKPVAETKVAKAAVPQPKDTVDAPASTRLQERAVADKDLNGFDVERSAAAPPAAAPPAAEPVSVASFASQPPPRDILGTLSKERVS